jgi:chemotaxis protein CheD
MNSVIVDIADAKISGNPDEELVTYSLGSCVGVAVYDPAVRVGGMIHCMLPLSKVDEENAKVRPYMFVDTGMQLFLQGLFDMGVTRANAVVKVAGGASVLDKNGLFRIGERNYTVLRKVLWKNGMLIKAEDVGGDASRTIRLEVGTGRFTMRSNGEVIEM